tara:strand:- start:231 stop:1079 length:849 start_codon:yes stop_codon:yes gene_type:complete
MIKRIVLCIASFFFVSHLLGQISSIDITLDDRLLRSDEKQGIINLKNDIKNFYQNTTWDENYSDLNVELYIQLIFEGVAQKGNEKIYTAQALFSNKKDLRYFDKSIQFYYNSGSSLYYDPVLFEPLTGFLAYYAHLILGGEIDTYEFNGGNGSFELSRDIALRGSSSEYKKGWGYRITLVDNINRNAGLRKARLAWYIAMDLFGNGEIDEAIEEINLMLDGLQQSYQEIGRDNHTQYFLKTQSKDIANMLSVLGQRELLKDMKELDPDRRELYHNTLESISE